MPVPDRWVKIKGLIYVTVIAIRIINVRELTNNLLVYSDTFHLSSYGGYIRL
jgi:hypothetical protein